MEIVFSKTRNREEDKIEKTHHFINELKRKNKALQENATWHGKMNNNADQTMGKQKVAVRVCAAAAAPPQTKWADFVFSPSR